MIDNLTENSLLCWVYFKGGLPVKEIYNKKELEEFVEFKSHLKNKLSNEERAHLEQTWRALVKELNTKLHLSPTSGEGIELGKKFLVWVNTVYGKKYAHLRNKMMTEGFGKGKGFDDSGFTEKSVDWIRASMDAYWRQKIYRTLDNVGKIESKALLIEWKVCMVISLL